MSTFAFLSCSGNNSNTTNYPITKNQIRIPTDAKEITASLVIIDSDEIKPAQYSSGTVNKWRLQETDNMMNKMDASELNIFLDQSGERQTSKGLAKCFEKQILFGVTRANFFIGGAYGIDKSILPSRIQFVSLSEMTFTHQMVRLFLLEQIYRAFTIIRGEPYHNY